MQPVGVYNVYLHSRAYLGSRRISNGRQLILSGRKTI